MTWILGLLAWSAIGTGRRLRIEIFLMSFILIIASRTPEPTSPVAPVRITCILMLGNLVKMDYEVGDEQENKGLLLLVRSGSL